MRTVFAFAASAALALAAPVAGQTEPPEIVDVSFTGVRSLPADTVRAAVETRGPVCRSPFLALFCALDAGWAERRQRLDDAALERDVDAIEALYAARGYPSATAAYEVVPVAADRAAVRFDVVEGAPQVVRSVEVELPPSPPIAPPELPLAPGVVYSTPRVEEARRRIVTRYAEAGYPFAQAEVGATVTADAVDVELRAIPGPAGVFGAAEIVTEPPLSETSVRDRLAFEPGDPFRIGALERTLERLYALPIVEEVDVAPAPSPAGDSIVVPRFQVTTRRASGIEADVTVSAYDCFGGSTAWTARHLLGGPRVVRLGVGVSNLLAGVLSESLCATGDEDVFTDPNYRVDGSWREPIDPDTWLGLAASASRVAVARAYVRRSVELDATLARDFGGGWSGALGYAPEWTTLDEIRPMYCVLAGSCDAPLPGDLAGTPRLAPASLSVAWAPREARRPALGPILAPDWMLPLAPRWFYSTSASLAFAAAPTASEFTYGRALLDGAITRLLGRRVELGGRVRAGWLVGDEPLPPQVRFYGGGPRGVRGVAPFLLGPTYLLLRGDPDRLPCALETGACDGLAVDPDVVTLRPLGGDALVEASVEARVWTLRWLQLAAFLDFGALGGGLADDAVVTSLDTEPVLSPGIGALVVSPFGPVRIDLALAPEDEPAYPLVARVPGEDAFVFLGDVGLDRGGEGGWREFRRRLRVQLYVGLPF